MKKIIAISLSVVLIFSFSGSTSAEKKNPGAGYKIGNGMMTGGYIPPEGAIYKPNVGIPAAAKPPGFSFSGGINTPPSYSPSSVQQAPPTAMSSSTMNPDTGQGTYIN